ncbi:hypothetical protein [Pedobacter nototheniae]|uniref:hypothetical protein n=1 Tax=Pedobacter nototheniae TaxID=2488994 RepID=UPI00103C26F5|nr:hypothetical protein [Pedobacter nototheniae]
MKILKIFTVLFFLSVTVVLAQDFVVRSDDEVIRGTIKGTDYFAVFISQNDETDVVLSAGNVKSFFWNGDTYLSKGFANGKNFEYRFVKVIEMGAVNLYAFGGGTLVPAQKQRKVRFSPSVGIGAGTGGYSGMGLGGGISIGGGIGGRNDRSEKLAGSPAVRYFIEKPGTGPMQELPIKAITEADKKSAVKSILLQKLGDQPELLEKVEANTELNSRDVIELVKAYNEKKN